MRSGTTELPTVLRRWRAARATTQAQVAAEAEISTRHLSFLESARARPSRQMVLLLSSAFWT
ncbi:MAG: helix-turn-helix transcriptional regulator [Deltaproteobacteria bacterium]|nr:helix-turn-helix transcriptional regulator [Deltaproteobacteria bacterium]